MSSADNSQEGIIYAEGNDDGFGEEMEDEEDCSETEASELAADVELLEVDDGEILEEDVSDSDFESLPPPIHIPDALRPVHMRGDPSWDVEVSKDSKKKKSIYDDSSDDDDDDTDTSLSRQSDMTPQKAETIKILSLVAEFGRGMDDSDLDSDDSSDADESLGDGKGRKYIKNSKPADKKLIGNEAEKATGDNAQLTANTKMKMSLDKEAEKANVDNGKSTNDAKVVFDQEAEESNDDNARSTAETKTSFDKEALESNDENTKSTAVHTTLSTLPTQENSSSSGDEPTTEVDNQAKFEEILREVEAENTPDKENRDDESDAKVHIPIRSERLRGRSFDDDNHDDNGRDKRGGKRPDVDNNCAEHYNGTNTSPEQGGSMKEWKKAETPKEKEPSHESSNETYNGPVSNLKKNEEHQEEQCNDGSSQEEDDPNGEYYTLDELRKKSVPNLDYLNREKYLRAVDFKKTLGCTKEEFYTWPKWKQTKAKRSAKLF